MSDDPDVTSKKKKFWEKGIFKWYEVGCKIIAPFSFAWKAVPETIRFFSQHKHTIHAVSSIFFHASLFTLAALGSFTIAAGIYFVIFIQATERFSIDEESRPLTVAFLLTFPVAGTIFYFASRLGNIAMIPLEIIGAILITLFIFWARSIASLGDGYIDSWINGRI